ncbi:hypothetical protein C0992_005812 [Termitomyces sp. T32_za158]|nr:hypothetical protein C0992_005812 [Termitomyces sp. T32_za158]
MSLILAANAGSSSLKISLFRLADPVDLVLTCSISNITAPPAQFCFNGVAESLPAETIADHASAFAHFLTRLDDPSQIACICHRVVHGGDYAAPVVIDHAAYDHIAALSDLAPLHNGAALAVIKACLEKMPNAKSIAYFDSAFHATIPRHIASYAIDQCIASKRGLRKYGFHGLSYSFILRSVAQFLEQPPTSLNLIVLHLGSGASACAIKAGQSLDTSMGLTPLSGLPGATRSGAVDPSLIFHYTNKAGRITHDPGMAVNLHVTMAEDILNRKSGWQVLTGTTDFGEIVKRARIRVGTDAKVNGKVKVNGEESTDEWTLAFDLFVDRVLDFVGAYHLKLGAAVDALVFSGGIGERSKELREVVAARARCLGYAKVDPAKNAELGQGVVVDIGHKGEAFYIPIVGFEIVGVAVVLLCGFDAPRSYQSKDILAIVALHDIPFLHEDTTGSGERKIGLLDPLDMMPLIFEISHGFGGPATEHDNLSEAILKNLCQQGWDIAASTCLEPCRSVASIWEKFGSSLNLDQSLVKAISTEFSSSVKWQTHAYENPPPAPQFSSSSIAWEQSIVEDAQIAILFLGVGIKLTSAVRTISPASAYLGPRFSRHVVPALFLDPMIVTVAKELASVVHQHPDGEIAKHCAAIIREAHENMSEERGERLIVCTALVESGHSGEGGHIPPVIRVFGLDTEEKRIQWLSKFVRMLFDAFLPSVLHNGVAFECHPQNCLARFDLVTKELKGFIIRDFGGLRVHPETLKASTGVDLDVHEGHSIIAPDLDDVYTRMYHTVFHNHLQQLIRVLGLHYNGRGWDVVREHLNAVIPKHHPLYAAWLSPERKSLPSKCFLRMRMSGMYRFGVTDAK